ncbi:hypothetical protein GF359_10225 [candidate division WOR-3 bacterium]|uniref:Uncharacterized protein n=1 Tax=candidate division WOR-3 bacterium TaxID=2052148 RepID=A0A9D5QDZ7_UNCW3|nr:hypothetical protein [candidate division WOR-3 bacterium]MBD3365576.1 hypothetical protein [candidate division WOR-3 bacterium]
MKKNTIVFTTIAGILLCVPLFAETIIPGTVTWWGCRCDAVPVECYCIDITDQWQEPDFPNFTSFLAALRDLDSYDSEDEGYMFFTSLVENGTYYPDSAGTGLVAYSFQLLEDLFQGSF